MYGCAMWVWNFTLYCRWLNTYTSQSHQTLQSHNHGVEKCFPTLASPFMDTVKIGHRQSNQYTSKSPPCFFGARQRPQTFFLPLVSVIAIFLWCVVKNAKQWLSQRKLNKPMHMPAAQNALSGNWSMWDSIQKLSPRFVRCVCSSWLFYLFEKMSTTVFASHKQCFTVFGQWFALVMPGVFFQTI